MAFWWLQSSKLFLRRLVQNSSRIAPIISRAEFSLRNLYSENLVCGESCVNLKTKSSTHRNFSITDFLCWETDRLPRHRPSWLVIVTTDGFYKIYIFLLRSCASRSTCLLVPLTLTMAYSVHSTILSTQHHCCCKPLSTQHHCCCKSLLCIPSSWSCDVVSGSYEIGLIQSHSCHGAWYSNTPPQVVFLLNATWN